MTLDHNHMGHAHFWERAMTRRTFIGSAAVAGGAAATAGMWLPEFARAAAFAEADPAAIPGGTLLPFQPTPFHFFFPTPNPFSTDIIANGGGDLATIYDFTGSVGVAEINGDGIGTKTATGVPTHMFWAADVRFMKGSYKGTEGDTRTGAFAFI
jgi:hypothetical protein